jgi:hypothetical protein
MLIAASDLFPVGSIPAIEIPPQNIIMASAAIFQFCCSSRASSSRKALLLLLPSIHSTMAGDTIPLVSSELSSPREYGPTGRELFT